MAKKLNLKTIMFAVIAIAMFVCGISTLTNFANIKQANVNVEKQIETKVNAEGNEARIGTTEYATLEEAFAAAVDGDTIYCIASDIVVESTIAFGNNKNLTLLCDGLNVTITRNVDGELFYIGGNDGYGQLTIGTSANDQYKFTMNGNNKAYPMFVAYGATLNINCGNYMGNDGEIATIGPECGGCISGEGNEAWTNIYGGTFSNFMVTKYGGVVCCDGTTLNIQGGTFTNNSARIFGGAIYGFGENMKISNAIISNNTAEVGGGVAWIFGDGLFENVTITDNISTSDKGNDVFSGSTTVPVINSTIGDISLGWIDMVAEYYTGILYLISGNVDNIDFISYTWTLGEQTMEITPKNTIKISGDIKLTSTIKLDGIDGQNIVVDSAPESYGYPTITQLNNTYKIDGSAENFVSYYQDTGKAIVTYTEGIEVDKNDFTCTNGTIITSAQVEGGSATNLYLTAPSETTPSTGFVDEQLLPAIAVGLISFVAVVALCQKRRFNA